MTAATVTVVCDLFDGSGAAITHGTAWFAPSVTLTDAADGMYVPQAPVPAEFRSRVSPSVGLLPTDDPSVLPPGWAWGVQFAYIAGSPGSYNFFLPAGPASFTAAAGTPCTLGWGTTAALTSLPNGSGVQLSGGSVPSAFGTAATYYVVDSSGTTVSLATSRGGSAIASAGSGSGDLTVVQYNLSALSPVGTAVTTVPYAQLGGDLSGTPAQVVKIQGTAIAAPTGIATEYLNAQGGWTAPPGTDVISVFGRTGAVVADTGDYTAAQVGALAQPSGTASKGFVPVATGSGEAAAWGGGGGVTVMVPAPTGATATDTPAITTAITNLVSALSFGPATLLFQDGAYQADSNKAVIRSVSNFAVRSAGRTVIEQAPNRSALPNNVTGDIFVIADCTDFTVEGITFDGMRDAVAPLTPLTATANSGQASVTVAAGNGARYQAGQFLYLFGGLGTAEQNQSEGFGVGSGTPLTVSSITPGGGSGGGDKITFTTNLSNSYTHVSGTAVSDGFGPYAYTGAYLTPYQCASGNSVAGRTLSGEDQQNGLHLLNCQRFTVSEDTARNVWESPVKCGTGYSSTSLTDGCSQGSVTDCNVYHGYDQGISLWVTTQVTVKGCTANAAGWAGIALSAFSDGNVITGNQILNSVYRVPGDDASGSGIALEGSRNNQVKGNVVTGCYSLPLQVRAAPFLTGISGLNSINAPTLSAFLEGATAAGTSVQVSSTTFLTAGLPVSVIDRARTEALTVATVVDSTHVTFAETTRFSHAGGSYVAQRFSQENVFEGNTLSGSATNYCVNANLSARCTFKDNVITGWASGLSAFTFDITSPGAFGLPSGVLLAGDGAVVEGNRIWCATPGNGITVNGAQDMVISGNYLNGPCPSNGTAALFLGGVTDSVIEGNHVSEITGGEFGAWGIWVALGGASSNIIPARLTIADNEVRRVAAEGIFVQAADSLTITGNTVTSCGGQGGISLTGTTNSTVTGNIANSNQNSGIYLADDGSTYTTGNRVTGNTCRDDGSGVNVTTGAGWTQQYGILEAGHSNYNLFTGNEADSNAVSQITRAGANSYVWANVISGAVAAGAGPQNYAGALGDGSDGAATLDGTATVAWATKSGSAYYVNRDVFCTSLTINSGVTLYPNGWHVFCTGTLTNAGAITCNGGNASGATGGGGPNGLVGGTGGPTIGNAGQGAGTGAGTQAGSVLGSFAVGNGAAGGNGTAGSGGAARFGTTGNTSQFRYPGPIQTFIVAIFGTVAVLGTIGGSSGAGDSSNSGGGGGGSGGIIVIFAAAAINNGTISAAGGNGGTATAGNCGGGGGGGGGLILVYTLTAWTAGTASVAGGTAGSGHGSGTAGGGGGSGTVLNVIIQ